MVVKMTDASSGQRTTGEMVVTILYQRCCLLDIWKQIHLTKQDVPAGIRFTVKNEYPINLLRCKGKINTLACPSYSDSNYKSSGNYFAVGPLVASLFLYGCD